MFWNDNRDKCVIAQLRLLSSDAVCCVVLLGLFICKGRVTHFIHDLGRCGSCGTDFIGEAGEMASLTVRILWNLVVRTCRLELFVGLYAGWVAKSHYSDTMMSAMASQISGFSTVYLTVSSGAYQWEHQNSASLAFMRGIFRWPANSPHNFFPFYDVIKSLQH